MERGKDGSFGSPLACQFDNPSLMPGPKLILTKNEKLLQGK